jgi:membrane fusion protein (multidrug efflux system)
VQVGQRVAPGTPLMAIVPLDGVWVDANYHGSIFAKS